jgi:hypothetical protein
MQRNTGPVLIVANPRVQNLVSSRRLIRRLLSIAVLSSLLGACGGGSFSDYSLPSINIPRTDIFNTGTLSFSGRHEEFALPPPGPAELVNAQGQCAAAAAGTPEGGGVSLQMTECEVVRRVGAPERVEFTPNSGERAVVLTFTRGARPGVYTFLGGRLQTIERGPEPPAPQRAPAKKSGRA